MQNDLDKFTNQARFIRMIIDGKLVVSKKKKLVLVAELKKHNFKAFPKVADAIKEGELAPIADNDEEAEEDLETGANAYDYLLGMPIWSLTQERIDKLNKQIEDRELEIDTLIKLTKEDIWKRDLDEFLAEWRLQLDDDAKRQKKIDNLGRRASNKLKIGAAGPTRKRKAGDDSDNSDFAGPVRAKKVAPVKKKEPTGLMAGLAPIAAANQSKKGPKSKGGVKAAPTAAEPCKPPKKESLDVWMDLANGDSASDPPVAPIFKNAKTASATTVKPAPVKVAQPKAAPTELPQSEHEDSADEEMIRPAAARGRRAATKATTYTLDDSDDDNGDDLLFDVGRMVKGIGPTSQDSTSNSRPLFSTSLSRPGSSAGLPKKSLGSARQTLDVDDADDTDYAMLAPPPTDKKAVTARETVVSDESEDDDLFVESPPKPKPQAKPKKPLPAATSAPAAKVVPKKAPTSKKPAPKPVAEPKKLPLSPAAKAYAAKKAKQQRLALDDEDEEMDDEVEKVANELLDDDEDDEPVAKRPARKAAVAAVSKKKGWGGGSDDEEDDEESESEGFEEEGSSFD